MTARARRGWLVGLVGAAVIVAVVVLARRGRSAGQEAAPTGGKAGGDRPVPVLVTAAETRDVPITLEGLGTVTAYKTVNVRSQVDGRLDRVVYREGQPVKTGEVLAQVDPRPFTILLHQGEAALARDEAQLEGARRNLERYEAVGGQHLLPQQQIDDQRALVHQLEGTVLADRAQIENAKLQLDYARIKSPIDGVTGVRLVDPGNLVHAADATGIVVVTQMDPIAVLFTLPQDDLGSVVAAQAAGPLPVEARTNDGRDIIASGKLELVDNQINQTTATIRLKAIFANPKRALWPNQFVKARLRLSVRKGALVIPAVSVQRGPQGTFVYVVGTDERAELRPVTIDRVQGEDAIVAQGVEPGERVVREGQSQLRPGAKLGLRPSAPAGGAPRGGAPSGSGGSGGGANRPGQLPP
jgi:multidrug efflux system membrane fusion protein